MNEKVLIFDVQFGASGDMLLASLVDLGLDPGQLTESLSGLAVRGWSLTPEKTTRHHFAGTRLRVECPDEAEERHLSEVLALLRGGFLSPKAEERAIRVFEALARAEASVHGIPVDRVHFHEVGALDSIIDIAAFAAALDLLGVDDVRYGDIYLGCGTTRSRHGEIPQPAPAVTALVRDRTVRFTDRQGEVITPTAAAILTTLGVQTAGTGPGITMRGHGTGFGSRDYPFPSLTRVFLAERSAEPEEAVLQIECNIDDMNPQIYPYLIDRLLAAGALDAYCNPVVMKKGRPGTALTVITAAGLAEELKAILYRETTTLGLREIALRREKLDRSFEEVSIQGHIVRVKVARHRGEIVNVQPEFEDCRRAAEETGAALKVVLEMAREAYRGKS